MVLYRKGSPKSKVVEQIQIALHLFPDGIFGINTESAVKDFQKANGLKVDGIVGPATIALLLKQGFNLRKSKRRIDEIIVHCSATPEGVDYTMSKIKADHLKQGWSDIGYHYVIYRDGSIVNGRNVDLVGAHCSRGGHNTHSIGVCYIGGIENKKGVPYSKLKAKDTRTEAQKNSLLSLLVDLKKLYPDAKIYGHRDFDNRKECPSFDAKTEYKNL